MKQLKFLIPLLVLFVNTSLFGQLSKTISQAIDIKGFEKIHFDLDSKEIVFKETKGSRILVQTKVTLSIPNENLLNFVTGNGRYDLISETDPNNSILNISSKKDKNTIILKGEECKEKIEYSFYIPSNVTYTTNVELLSENTQ